MAQPTAHEQYILELINRARLDPTAEAARLGIGLNDGLSAGTISTAAKAPLAFNPLLIDAADGHSAWMLATDSFSHTGANGSSAGDRMKAAGYAFTGSWTWGENIAIRWGGGTTENAATAQAFHDGLFRSAGHRTNILSENFREIGIGIATGEYKGSDGATVTEAFARSGSLAFLTGVAFDDKDGDRLYDPGEGLGGLSIQIRNAAGATWTTATWDAGGWQQQLAAGDYTVTFSGGGLAAPVVRSARLGTANVKLDLDVDIGAPANPGGLVLSGTAAADDLRGAEGNDLIRGLDGADRLYGNGGRDTIEGGAGNDIINGNAGDDRIIGGPGTDTEAGGSGADLFVYAAIADRGDTIVDFARAQGDRIDLSAIFGAGIDTQAQLLAGGYARLLDGSAGLRVQVDADGGGDGFVTLATLKGVTTASLGGDILIA